MSKSIPLTQGQIALVDDEDYPILILVKWHAVHRANKWYAVSHQCEKSNPIQMHGLLITCPQGFHTDHRDGDGLNNQKFNLRIVTNQQNQWNCERKKNCKSQYKGVHWHSARGKWQVDCGRRYFGLFTNEKEAMLVYNEKAKELYGEYARLNEV